MRFKSDNQRKAVMAKLRQFPVNRLIASENELRSISRGAAPEVYTHVYRSDIVPVYARQQARQELVRRKSVRDSIETTHKIISDLDDYYYNRAIDDQTYLMTENDRGERQGTTDDIPYYIEKNSIHFDSNANYKQTDMNIDMKNLMADAGITISDLKDNDILNYSYNSDADSYLSFVSAEQGISDDMLNKALPIMHGGEHSENEMQIDSIEDEYQRVGKDKGISFDDFKKYMQENQYLKDNLIYTPVNFSYVIWADKDKFIGLIKNKIRNITPKQKQRIKEIKNYRVE